MRPTIQAKLCLGLTAVFTGIALTGCGAGSKVITGVKFDDQVVNGDLQLAMDATLASGGLVLPKAVFPLYNPKNPSQVLGELETDGLHIIVSVDASTALKLPDLADGTKLPNGTDLPLTLPAGLTPVGIPVFNSNSRIYIAVNGDQILVGAAVTIAKEDRLNLPLQIFLPFTISPEIHGTGGFFLGDKQGVAVFALREKATSTTAPTLASSIGVKSLTASGSRIAGAQAMPKIEVKNEEITRSKINRLQRTWNGLRHVRID